MPVWVALCHFLPGVNEKVVPFLWGETAKRHHAAAVIVARSRRTDMGEIGDDLHTVCRGPLSCITIRQRRHSGGMARVAMYGELAVPRHQPVMDDCADAAVTFDDSLVVEPPEAIGDVVDGSHYDVGTQVAENLHELSL